MGRPDEFIDLYERDAETVLVFFVRRTFDTDLSLDLTAETFAQAWHGWARVRTKSQEEVRAWLFTIARRQLGRYLRRGQVERSALRRLRLAVPVLLEDDVANIERLAGVAQVREIVVEELRKLSAAQRAALELRVVQELSYSEVARRLGVSEPTARARVSRGLRTRARALEPAMI